MANSKRIHIRTVTIERYLTAVRPPTAINMFCASCGLPTEMLSISDASAETGISMRNLFWLSDQGPIHATETDSGQLMICRRSLNSIGDLSGVTATQVCKGEGNYESDHDR